MESSAKPASVAVCSNGELLGQNFQNSGLTHSRTLLSMADSLLKNLGISAADIELFAVSRGPGSFTGVRIGVSAVKGLAWGLNKPVCGVSTLEAMAYQTPVPDVLLCPVMDARRDQVYNALFRWRNGTPGRLRDDRAISLADLAADLRILTAAPPLSSSNPPDNSEFRIPNSEFPPSVLLIGDGAKISYDYLSATGVPCRIAPDLMRWQTAFGVAIAALNARQIPAIELEPSYLRPSQAERERMSK